MLSAGPTVYSIVTPPPQYTWTGRLCIQKLELWRKRKRRRRRRRRRKEEKIGPQFFLIRAQCTMHSAQCTVHCALCTVHCALCTVHCASPLSYKYCWIIGWRESKTSYTLHLLSAMIQLYLIVPVGNTSIPSLVTLHTSHLTVSRQ